MYLYVRVRGGGRFGFSEPKMEREAEVRFSASALVD
jgi:hypothetical protein